MGDRALTLASPADAADTAAFAGRLLRLDDAAVVRAALRLAPMLMLRPGELRHAQWSEIDLDAARWEIPAARMKRERDGKLHGLPFRRWMRLRLV